MAYEYGFEKPRNGIHFYFSRRYAVANAFNSLYIFNCQVEITILDRDCGFGNGELRDSVFLIIGTYIFQILNWIAEGETKHSAWGTLNFNMYCGVALRCATERPMFSETSKINRKPFGMFKSHVQFMYRHRNRIVEKKKKLPEHFNNEITVDATAYILTIAIQLPQPQCSEGNGKYTSVVH